jgi:hypothetical protein
MQYLLLIYSDESRWEQLTEQERGQLGQEYGAYTTEMREKGAFLAGAPLQSTSTATTVQLRDGKQVVTDGPFAETKEQLGGYYLVDVESLDDAIDWAARMPSARFGKIEVRPVMDMEGPPQ